MSPRLSGESFLLVDGLVWTAYIYGRFPEARDRLEQIRSFTSQQPEPEFLLELGDSTSS